MNHDNLNSRAAEAMGWTLQPGVAVYVKADGMLTQYIPWDYGKCNPTHQWFTPATNYNHVRVLEDWIIELDIINEWLVEIARLDLSPINNFKCGAIHFARLTAEQRCIVCCEVLEAEKAKVNNV